MCERYSLASSLSDIEAYYQIDKMAFPFKSSYLLEPTQPVPVIVAEGGSRRLEHYRWGSSLSGRRIPSMRRAKLWRISGRFAKFFYQPPLRHPL